MPGKNNILLSLLFLACALAWCGNALFAADAAATQWLPVQIDFSDGTTAECELQPMGGKSLTINSSPDKRSRLRKVDYGDILEIRQEVEESQQNAPWMYAESGKNVRIELSEESYPLLNFSTTLVLGSGEVVRGHIISVTFRTRTSQESGKLFLKRQIKGALGQQASELLFPVRIRFTAHAPYDAKGIAGFLPPQEFGRLSQVVAIDLERRIVIDAKVNGVSGEFAFPPLLKGTYELYAITDRYILAGFPSEESTAKPPAELESAFRLADDFFNDRLILRQAGSRTLVWKQRKHVYDEERHLDGGVLRHLEVWNWHQAGKEWKLDSRNMPVRLKQQGGEADRKLLLVHRFCAVSPGADLKLTAADLGTPLAYPPPTE